MRLFSVSGASYYCASYVARGGDAEGSVNAFFDSHIRGKASSLREGTPLFEDYRSCSLRDVERCLFLAASHYRRCLDTMIPSAASWAYVTIYYGSWYSARAILGMFGCTVFKKYVIDVGANAAGRQELNVKKIGKSPGQESTTYSGSHREFWDLFYTTVTPLLPLVSPHLSVALTPIGSDPIWQITQRNEINYDTNTAIRLVHDFQSTFSKSGFPASLPGVLRTQYGIFEAMLELAFSYAKQFGLATDALSIVSGGVPLKKAVNQMIYSERSPALISKTKKGVLLKA